MSNKKEAPDGKDYYVDTALREIYDRCESGEYNEDERDLRAHFFMLGRSSAKNEGDEEMDQKDVGRAVRALIAVTELQSGILKDHQEALKALGDLSLAIGEKVSSLKAQPSNSMGS